MADTDRVSLADFYSAGLGHGATSSELRLGCVPGGAACTLPEEKTPNRSAARRLYHRRGLARGPTGKDAWPTHPSAFSCNTCTATAPTPRPAGRTTPSC